MSTPDEVKLQDKIQKLEMRMLGGDGTSKQQQVSTDIANSAHSNSHLGSAGNSSGGSGETHITTVKDAQSHSLLFTKDSNLEMAGGHDGSRENHDNGEEGSKKDALDAAHTVQSLNHDVRSNHSGSLSRISPLKPSGPNTTTKGTRSVVKESAMNKRKNPDGSAAALRDLNSVLKHLPGVESMALAGGEEKKEDGSSQPPEAKHQKIGNTHDGESTNGSASITILGEKEGSRPSGGGGGGGGSRTQRKIASYFGVKGGETGAGSSSSSSSSIDDKDRHTMRSPQTVGDDTNSSVGSTAISVGGTKRGGGGRGARQIHSSASGDGDLSDREVRKQLEALKAAKEQSSQRAFRVEMELKAAMDRQKLLEERNLKIIGSLETANREMARQEGRRKRDRLALDCVRLGKIATMRTGPTQYGEVWEEGYALKELNRRSAEFVERREELQRRRSELTKAKTKAKKKEASGTLEIEILKPGDAVFKPKIGDTCMVHYIGRLQDGTIFDNSYDRQQAIYFILGTKQVIPGWEQAIEQMSRGQHIRATIPPDLAYSTKGYPPIIPPNATLVYDIELISFSSVGVTDENVARDTGPFDPHKVY